MSVEVSRPSRTDDPVTISPLSFWADTSGREQSLKTLRDERLVSWHPPSPGR